MDWIKAHAEVHPGRQSRRCWSSSSTTQRRKAISAPRWRRADLSRAQRPGRRGEGLSPGPTCAKVARVPTADKLWKGILVALMVAGGIGWLVFAIIVALALLY